MKQIARILISVAALGIIGGQANAETQQTNTSGGGLNSKSVKVIPQVPTFVAVGSNGAIIQSQDNTNWSSVNSGYNSSLTSVTQGSNGVIVSTGTGVILNSTDNITWNTSSVANKSLLQSVAVNANNFFIAVGENGAVLNSTDGVNWSGASAVPQTFNGVTSGANNGFVVVGNSGTIYYSSDSKSWIKGNNVTTQPLYGVSANLANESNSEIDYVAVGGRGTILTSTDGSHWQQQISNAIQNIYAVATTNITNSLTKVKVLPQQSTYIAVGKDGLILYSNDAINWTQESSPTNQTLYAVAIDSLGNYAAVGANGTVISSNDGQNWHADNSGTTATLYGITSTMLSKYPIHPTVALLTPSNNATNVPVTQIIQVQFNESVSNVIPTNVTLTSNNGNQSITIAAGANNTYAITSNGNLAHNTLYKLTLGNGISSSGGNLTPTTFNFTTVESFTQCMFFSLALDIIIIFLIKATIATIGFFPLAMGASIN